jgi:hypothetical protein
MSHYAQFPALFREIVPPATSRGKTKSRLAITLDFMYLFFVLKVVPRNYYLFSFNEKSREEFKAYMDESGTPLLKSRLYKTLWNDSYSSLVNDKYVFHCLCRYHGIPVPDVYGIYAQGKFKKDGSTLQQVMDSEKLEEVILKPLKGMQGKGIYFASRNGTGVRIEPVRVPGDTEPPRVESKDDFIVQEIICQHPALDRVNPRCLNTIRIITLLTRDDDVKFLAAMLRTNSGPVPIDNFSLGGIVIGIDINTGTLKPSGFMKGRAISEVKYHPLTGIAFEGLEIPHWNALKECAAKAQKVFNELKSVGWDLAITREGPVMIEGNIEWGTTGIQATNGGLLTAENRALFSQYGLTFYNGRRG